VSLHHSKALQPPSAALPGRRLQGPGPAAAAAGWLAGWLLCCCSLLLLWWVEAETWGWRGSREVGISEPGASTAAAAAAGHRGCLEAARQECVQLVLLLLHLLLLLLLVLAVPQAAA